jgi:dTDP-glucose 4,6-dehydratase
MSKVEFKRIVVAGGAGFIGSHVVDFLARSFRNCSIAVLDKLTYAASRDYLDDAIATGRVELVVADIADYDLCRQVLRKADIVFNLAAESHVDQSFGNPLLFTYTNSYGAHCLIEAARSERVQRFVHASSDEVYGEVPTGSRGEGSTLMPTNPYSASKAAAEMIMGAYTRTYRMDIRQVRANNIVGTRQFPEKIIPKFICSLLDSRPLTLHGDGLHRRCYLMVEDFCRAVEIVASAGAPGAVYNVGTQDEFTNLEAAEQWIVHVADRPFNDRRYSVDSSRIQGLGWKQRASLRQEMPRLTRWYAERRAQTYADRVAVRREPALELSNGLTCYADS